VNSKSIACPDRGLLADLEHDRWLLIEMAESDGRDPLLELARFLMVQNARLEHEASCPTCKREFGIAA
jgi:hypothetical protein